MAQRFSQKEAMIACWFLASYSDGGTTGGTTKETNLINHKLLEKYDLWSKFDYGRFVEKWTKWLNEDGYEKILNHCKKILDDADYSVRIKTLAGMWAVSVDTDSYWSSEESKYFLAMEEALNVKREDIEAEMLKIGEFKYPYL